MELPKTTFFVSLGASTVYVAGGGGVNYRPNPNLTLDLSPESGSVFLREIGVNDIPPHHLSHSHLNGELAPGQGLTQPSVTLYGNSMGDANSVDQGQGLGQAQGQGRTQGQGLAQGVVIAQPVRHWLFVEHHVGDLQGTRPSPLPPPPLFLANDIYYTNTLPSYPFSHLPT